MVYFEDLKFNNGPLLHHRISLGLGKSFRKGQKRRLRGVWIASILLLSSLQSLGDYPCQFRSG